MFPSINVSSVTPQGSILGMLLLILRGDELSRVGFTNSGQVAIFADNIVYFREVVTPARVLTSHCDVDLLTKWIASKHLRLNVQKSQYMVISRKRKKPECTIFAAGVPLERISLLRYLGVTITDDLS